MESKAGSKLYKPYQDMGLSPHTISSCATLKRVRDLHSKAIDHEEHDSAIFRVGGVGGQDYAGGSGGGGGGISKVRSAGKLNLSPTEATKKRTRNPSLNKSLDRDSAEVAFKIAFSPVDNEE